MFKRLNKKSVIISWGYFFAGLMIFVSIVFGLFSYSTQKKVKEQSVHSAEYVYRVALDSVKYHLSSLVNQHVRMLESGDLKALLSKEDTDYFHDANAMNLLDELVLQNSIDSAAVSYIYFKDKGVVFSQNGIFPARRYFDEHFSGGMAFEQWDRLHQSTEFIPQEVTYTGEDTNQSVMLCLPIYAQPFMSSVADCDAVVAFVLKKNRFFALSENFNWILDAKFYLIEENGNILFRSANAAEENTNINGVMQRPGDNFSELEYFYYKSKKIGLYFQIPFRSLYPEQYPWQMVMFLCFIVLFIGIAGATILFITFNYRKIRSMIKMLPDDGGNELDILESNLERMMRENQEYNKAQNIMEMNLRSAILRMALYVPDEVENVREYLDTNDLDFGTDLICVSLFGAEEAEQEAIAPRLQSAALLLAEWIKDMPEPGYVVTLKNNTIAVIAGVSKNSGGSLNELLEQAAQRVFEQYGLRLRVFTSAPQFLSNIPAAYRDALCQMETGGRKMPELAQDILFCTMEDKIKIFENLSIGNQPAARQTLDAIFEKIYTGNYSSKVINIFAVDMVSLLLDIAQRKNVGALLKAGVFNSDKNYILGDDVKEMHENLKKMMDEICAEVSEGEKSINNQLCERMFEYIAANYRDPEISLKVIADRFQTSSSYASANFSKLYGKSPSYFINKYRVEEAEQLLHNPVLTVEKIAEMVGYGHERTFSRNFKKLKGMYPYDYRKLL